MRLSQETLQQLKQMQEALVGRGDIFFLPPDRVHYGHDREPHEHPCLVVAVDRARAHLVAGTSGSADGPALVVRVGETDLPHETEFDFRDTWPLSLTILVTEGRPMGRLAETRHPEIDAAALASPKIAVRRLTKLGRS